MLRPTSPAEDRVSRRLFDLSIGVFFFGGFLTAVVGLLVPRLTITLGLDYSRALLIQFAFHLSYLLFAVPVTLAIVRIGYMRAITSGLSVMIVGCLALTAAARMSSFALVLVALLTLSTGITFLQIAANTVVTVVGPSRRAAARLTLLQAFNSLGTVLGPLLGAIFLLGSIGRGASGSKLWETVPFVISAIGLFVLALGFFAQRDLLPRPDTAPAFVTGRRIVALLRSRRMVFGVTAIFAYVGAEVTIGTLLPNYLMLPDTLRAAPVAAGQMSSLYWSGAMVGRFAGAFLLRRVDAGAMLAAAGIGAMVLATVAGTGHGWVAAIALLAVGLCNAIMYPTIYALAISADPLDAPLGSMLLCMAVVGGAIVPLMTGALADRVGLAPSLLLPACCYAVVALFGWRARA